MRYLFLLHLFVVAAVVAIGGVRGTKSPNRPLEVFNDMDRQGKLKAQKPSGFFADGEGGRPLVPGTVPSGYDFPHGPAGGKASPARLEFGTGDSGYYNTGRFGDHWGAGLPEELALDEGNMAAFLRRGQERYSIYCGVCHGESGNGQGVVSKAGFNNVANLLLPNFAADQYADGTVYHTIANGKGLMGAYGDKLTLRDRWAVVAWVRVLQKIGNGVPVTEPGVKELLEQAAPAQGERKH